MEACWELLHAGASFHVAFANSPSSPGLRRHTASRSLQHTAHPLTFLSSPFTYHGYVSHGNIGAPYSLSILSLYGSETDGLSLQPSAAPNAVPFAICYRRDPVRDFELVGILRHFPARPPTTGANLHESEPLSGWSLWPWRNVCQLVRNSKTRHVPYTCIIAQARITKSFPRPPRQTILLNRTI